MDPQIIPYGWGLFSEAEEVMMASSNAVENVTSHHVKMRTLLMKTWLVVGGMKWWIEYKYEFHILKEHLSR